MKGSRVQSIIRELRGEKIDIIPFHEDIVNYAQNALAPAKITRVSVTSDEQAHRPHLDVIVDNDQLSLAIGKRGLNVRLAAEQYPHKHHFVRDYLIAAEKCVARFVTAKILRNDVAAFDGPPNERFGVLGTKVGRAYR